MEKRITIITHSGSFHPDDVFAVASLLLLHEGKSVMPEVVRTRDPHILQTGDFVLDVGGVYDASTNRFDHHQIDGAGVRPNRIPYASFGLVWKKYGAEIAGSPEVAGELERRLVIQIDALDNGVEAVAPLIEGVRPYLVNHVIFSYIPTWKSSEPLDEAFLVAVGFAKELLKREIRSAADKIEGERFVEEAYQNAVDKRLIMLDREYFWAEQLARHPEPLLVIYPQRENYHIKAVRDSLVSFKTRVSFPESWAGKRDVELAKVTGVPDAFFCHNKRFMVVAGSKEGALALAQKALKA
ncbi:MAG: hypothetical protein A3C06_03075 [Candidatus Taylorbacteria bacterium RIFCSPHIGHO2_02_FULL_46_13]|uniref:Metal-dependent hydrolase n=1 Tax=Candidatus Taylorbacteria bacterium RIFCSPHIGHO2_02_FULL_46_13 TaxID=1802312 RepID=A0A1G2MS21_9BACT|nr:MAG: hypothetical protein A3C06_03075 [Candidatus Taylorbacteria bacterium RIFCSPHIGHO2_02_FULL_46_13]